jgi:hypothetical protein
MKKLFALLLVMQLLTISSLQVFASTTDEELAALLNDLEWGTTTANTVEEPEEVEEVAEEPTAEEQHQAAEDILDAMDEDTWAYAGEEKIEVKNVTTTGAHLLVTQVTYQGTPVTQYKVYYSDKTLATVQDFDQISDRVLDVKSTEGNTVTLDFDALEANKTYYVVVAPVHPTDPTQEPLSFISDEVMFTTQQEVAVAAVTEKVFENVSYTYKDSMVTVTWTPSSAADNTQIDLRHQSEATYTKIGSPMVNEGSFSFTVSKPGTYFLKMSAMNAAGVAVGQEHIQTIKIDEVQQPAEVVQAAPTVGPATNLMIALMLFSVIVYAGVKYRKAN